MRAGPPSSIHPASRRLHVVGLQSPTAEAVEAALDQLQGTSRARTITIVDVVRLAQRAEAELDALGIPAVERLGCEYHYTPWPVTRVAHTKALPKAYGPWIRLRRAQEGWKIVELERNRVSVSRVPIRDRHLWITRSIHEQLVRRFSRQFLGRREPARNSPEGGRT